MSDTQKYFQAALAMTGITTPTFSDIVSVQLDFEGDVIESRIAGERVVRVHGQKGKKFTGSIKSEKNILALCGEQAETLTITLLDETGGENDLPIALGKTEFHKLGVEAASDDGSPVPFAVTFQSEPLDGGVGDGGGSAPAASGSGS